VSADLFLFYVVLVLQRSEELLEEVILSRTLNYLRGDTGDVYNSCTTFIETIEYVIYLICSKGFPYCNYLGYYTK
jgi:hypothetical protein